MGTENEGSAVFVELGGLGKLVCIVRDNIEQSLGEVRDEAGGRWKSNSKGQGRSRSVVAVRRKGWLDSKAQGCWKM